MVAIVFLFIPCLIIAQDQVVININFRTMDFIINNNADGDVVKNTMEKDTSYHCYNQNFSKQAIKKDTFYYVRTEIINNGNIIGLIPTLYRRNYQLNKNLKGKPLGERDSIINLVMQKQCEWRPSRGYGRISCKITPVQYYQDKYPYVDVYKTYYEKGVKKKWYTSSITRIFIIKEVWYIIYINNESLKTSKSIFRSRKAVCCDFKRLVNNIKIIEAEEGCGGT